MRRFTSIGFSCTSRPHTETAPALGGMKPVIMRMVVDLPARFGPKDLLRFSTLIKALSKTHTQTGTACLKFPAAGRRNRILSQPRSEYKQMTNDHQPTLSSGGMKAL